MKPDKSRDHNSVEDIHAVERAHLRDPRDESFVIYREEVVGELAPLARRLWMPVWSVPVGEVRVQEVLQYPVGLVVISPDYARFYGASRGLSRTELAGESWAFGVMLTPAAGSLIAGESMDNWVDRYEEISQICDVQDLIARIRDTMNSGPHVSENRCLAMDEMSQWLATWMPIDDEGHLINKIVDYIEDHRDVTAVSEVCDQFHLTERSLQRLTRKRVGLSPKWIIQRRRLHELSQRLRQPGVVLADIAGDIGYADESHLVRDFRIVTGMTPGAFAARFSGE